MSDGAVSANRLELLQIADAVAREKSIDKMVVIEAMQDAIQRAAKSRYGAENDIRAEIDPQTGEMSVDWSRSKCHPLEPSHAHIFINLKGRDPHGIVDPKDYKRVQQEIKDALMNIRDPETGESAMAAVFTKDEASTVNIYEGKAFDRIGDVLFAFKPGYLANTFVYPAAVRYADGTERIIPNPEEHEPSILGRHFSGAHVTLPGIPEMECAVIMSGPGIPHLHPTIPMDICDIAPTIATLLGIPVPQDAEGSIRHEIVKQV